MKKENLKSGIKEKISTRDFGYGDLNLSPSELNVENYRIPFFGKTGKFENDELKDRFSLRNMQDIYNYLNTAL